jgi:hypothetical protein
VNESVRHWHVVLTLTGGSVEPLISRGAKTRLSAERPFLDSLEVGSDTAEIQYWDQGESMLDVASLAMRLWNEHRESANLPDWEVVGLEVVEKSLRDRRGDQRWRS